MHRTQNLTVSAADTDDTEAVVTPADILRGAARYLTVYGWVQSSYYGGHDNNPFPPACADGAIGMAAFGGMTTCPGREGDNPHFRDYNRAFHVFSGHLQQTGWQPPCEPWCPGAEGCLCAKDAEDIVFAWNDDDTRTADDVIAALHAAADEWDWQHATSDDLETYGDACFWAGTRPTREGFLAWLVARS